jgi:hypothetical protein
MSKNQGTPNTIEQAIINALTTLRPDSQMELIAKTIREHLEDFCSQKVQVDDDLKSEAYIEYFQKIFDIRPKGYIRTLQWFQGARKLSDFERSEIKDETALAVFDIIGCSRYEKFETKPDCPKGHVILRINYDDSLTLIQANYDTSD